MSNRGGKSDLESFRSKSSSSSIRSNRTFPRFSLRRLFCGRPPMSGRSSGSSKRSSSEVRESRSLASIGVQREQPGTSTESGYVKVGTASQSLNSSTTGSSSTQSESSYDVESGGSGGEITAVGGGSGKLMECALCVSVQHERNFPRLSTCHHRTCRDCMRKYLRIEITESRVQIACPECSEMMHPNDITDIIDSASLKDKYEEFMLRRVLVSDPDTRWCPAPDCGYAVIAVGCASCPRLECQRPGCQTSFCYHCKQHWHPDKTCTNARQDRVNQMFNAGLNSIRTNLRASVSYTTYSHDSKEQVDIKACPRCSAFITKMNDGSCNHMTCTVCAAEFCWLCMKEISDLHYLSPSGCTFWGKKPWSRKKKVIWQLGTLIGAPVGISLFAGVAIPSIIIGVPVWVWHKLHRRYENAPTHKRNLIITGGVAASILVSPLVAAVTVGIGVPILLAYVYGVVPIALCRSGCGVSTTQTGGVRFEFDEDHDGHVTMADAQSMASANHTINPSIAPSIGEVSLGNSLLSASAGNLGTTATGMMCLDETDRDSSSRQVLTGASLEGSISGVSTAPILPNQHHQHHHHHQHNATTSGAYKLEVQADCTPQTISSTQQREDARIDQRSNFSCDSVSCSIAGDIKVDARSDSKSVTVSFQDDASTKALAGSICYRDNVSVELDAQSPTSNISTSSYAKRKSLSLASVSSTHSGATAAGSATAAAAHKRASKASGTTVLKKSASGSTDNCSNLSVDHTITESTKTCVDLGSSANTTTGVGNVTTVAVQESAGSGFMAVSSDSIEVVNETAATTHNNRLNRRSLTLQAATHTEEEEC